MKTTGVARPCLMPSRSRLSPSPASNSSRSRPGQPMRSLSPIRKTSHVSQPPTNELAIRKAVAHAIDRDTIIESVLLGYAEKARAGVTTTSPFYNEDLPMVEYDPEEAGRILDEAGWVMGAEGVRERDGQKLTLNQISTDFENWGLFNQIIQEQLQAIGINSEISTLEWNAYLDQWRENQGGWNVTYHQQGTQVAATEAIEAGWTPDDYWTITQIDDATDPDLVAVRDRLQELWDEWQVTLDADRRQELATEAQTIYQDNQLAAWLWHRAYIHAFQPRLKDYRLTDIGRLVELDKAWIEE